MCVLFSLVFLLLSSRAVESKVIALTEDDFETKLKNYPLALIKFYAPWCGHCKALAPEYIKAADKLALSQSSDMLFEVDCTEHSSLCEKHGISGYPTLKIFRNGKYEREYTGPRNSDGIAEYMLRRAAPTSIEISSIDEIENQRHVDLPTIVAYFKSEKDDFKKHYIDLASTLLDNTLFMHTHKNIFSTDADRFIRLYMPKKLNSPLETPTVDFTGQHDSTNLKEWIKKNGVGIFGHRTQKTEFFYPESDILVIYHNISFTDDPAGIKYFRNRVLKALKGTDLTDMQVAYCDSMEYVQELNSFGFTGVLPLAAIRTKDGKKYVMESFSFAEIPKFIEKYRKQELLSFTISDPIPTSDDGPVKTIVAVTFSEVTESTKDVLIVFHAPWCGHCKSLMPKFTEAAQKLANEPGVMLAKMDATTNDVPKPYSVQGFPTIYFVPKNDKKNPRLYTGGREVQDIIAYVAKHSTDELVGFNRDGSPKKTDL